MLQTIEPVNPLYEFTVFVRVIGGVSEKGKRVRVLIRKTLNTGGVSSLVSPLD